jgi:hypothetical protein
VAGGDIHFSIVSPGGHERHAAARLHPVFGACGRSHRRRYSPASPNAENPETTMPATRDRHRPESDEAGANRQTSSLAGLAVTLALIVACLFLIRQLHHKAAVEDCLMSGRTNCDKVLVRAR